MNGKNLIFIISQPRAGSTLLQRILANHPDIHTSAEPWLLIPPLLGYSCAWTSPEGREAQFARQNTRQFLSALPGGKDFYFKQLHEMYSHIYDLALLESGKKYFLDKTPRYAYFINEIYELFPEATFLFLIRNPLAVLCSIIKNWTGHDKARLWKDHSDDLYHAPYLIFDGTRKNGLKGNVIHFEELTESPGVVLKKICDSLQLAYSPEMVAYGQNSSLPRWNFGDSKIYQYVKPEPAVNHQWIEDLKDPFIWRLAEGYLNHLGDDFLAHLGYSFSDLKIILEKNKPKKYDCFSSIFKKTIWQKAWKGFNSRKNRFFEYLKTPNGLVRLFEPVFWLMGYRDIFSTQEMKLGGLNRILVIKPDHLGDAVLATPFLRELRRNCPTAEISLLTHASNSDFFKKCPYVNNVLPYLPSMNENIIDGIKFITYKFPWAYLKIAWKYLWPLKFDAAILLRYDVDYYFAAYLIYLSGAKYRVGYSETLNPLKRQFNKDYDSFLNRVIYDLGIEHEVKKNLKIITALKGQVCSEEVEVWPDDSGVSESISYWINLLSHEKECLKCCFGIGAASFKKRWPAEKFARLAYWLKENFNMKIVLLGNGAETDLAEEFLGHLDDKNDIINLVGKTNIHEIMAVLPACDLYVGNDTGLKHLAAAFKLPVYEISCLPQREDNIFSDYHPARFGCWLTSHKVFGPKDAIPPCTDTNECHEATAHCIKSVDLKEIQNALWEDFKDRRKTHLPRSFGTGHNIQNAQISQ